MEDSPKLAHKWFGDSTSLHGEMSGMMKLKIRKKAIDTGASHEDDQSAPLVNMIEYD